MTSTPRPDATRPAVIPGSRRHALLSDALAHRPTDAAEDIPSEWLWVDMAPERDCCLCASATDTLDRVKTPLGASWSEQRLAVVLRMADVHVHTAVMLNGHEADMVLPLMPRRTIVENDGGWVHKFPKAVANEISQARAWTALDMRLVRLREPKLPVTGPLDLRLPRGLNKLNDWELTAIIVDHVLHHAGLADDEVADRVARATQRTGCGDPARLAIFAERHRHSAAEEARPSGSSRA